MKLLPLYTNCILKSDALSGSTDITTDDRSWLMDTVMSMGVDATHAYFYPRLLPLVSRLEIFLWVFAFCQSCFSLCCCCCFDLILESGALFGSTHIPTDYNAAVVDGCWKFFKCWMLLIKNLEVIFLEKITSHFYTRLLSFWNLFRVPTNKSKNLRNCNLEQKTVKPTCQIGKTCKQSPTVIFVSPERSSERDYVITDSVYVCMLYVYVCGNLRNWSLYPHTLMYSHGTWTQWSLGKVTHVTSTDVTSTDVGSKVI